MKGLLWLGDDQLSSHYPEIDGHKLTDFIHELPFYLGNVMKYAWRAPYKGGIDDTLKLMDYLGMARKSWVGYSLSDEAVKHLSKISSYDFYSHHEGLEKAHRRCIRYVADLVIESDECEEMDDYSEKSLALNVGALQVELMHK
nr:MAG TPA: nucelotide kinase [Caudoviricetes sp.]